MGLPLYKILRSNVHYITTNGTGRVERQCLILMDRVDAELALVNSSLIYRIRYGAVDQFTIGTHPLVNLPTMANDPI